MLRTVSTPIDPIGGTFGIGTLSDTAGDTTGIGIDHSLTTPNDPTTQELYLDEHGPSLRALYDLGDPKQSRVMHSTGQSGNPLSPWYRDFVEPWTRVEYVSLWSAPTVSTLVLQPAR